MISAVRSFQFRQGLELLCYVKVSLRVDSLVKASYGLVVQS